MAEWKTDTEEVKQIVKKCRDFKGSFSRRKMRSIYQKP